MRIEVGKKYRGIINDTVIEVLTIKSQKNHLGKNEEFVVYKDVSNGKEHSLSLPTLEHCQLEEI